LTDSEKITLLIPLTLNLQKASKKTVPDLRTWLACAPVRRRTFPPWANAGW
jgi:hypothetical protein